jgi:hypothetical protein
VSEPTGTRTASRAPARTPVRTVRFRTGAVVAIAVAVGLILWLALRSTGSGSSGAEAVSPTQLQSLATSLGHPIFDPAGKAKRIVSAGRIIGIR